MKVIKKSFRGNRMGGKGRHGMGIQFEPRSDAPSFTRRARNFSNKLGMAKDSEQLMHLEIAQRRQQQPFPIELFELFSPNRM